VKQDGVAEASISAREAEVLAAVGEHLTNAEIATRLFVSIRTVESHVSSLLRKFGASDRRALSLLAAERSGDPAPPSGDTSRRVAPLPSPLTSFVGRTSERAELAAALRGPRLVTAVGPGGTGKTRLALAVAADVSERFADGVWYADLVPVSERSRCLSTARSATRTGSPARPCPPHAPGSGAGSCAWPPSSSARVPVVPCGAEASRCHRDRPTAFRLVRAGTAS
jgi:DNA-binding CsgD family transcriptional regulator